MVRLRLPAAPTPALCRFRRPLERCCALQDRAKFDGAYRETVSFGKLVDLLDCSFRRLPREIGLGLLQLYPYLPAHLAFRRQLALQLDQLFDLRLLQRGKLLRALYASNVNAYDASIIDLLIELEQIHDDAGVEEWPRLLEVLGKRHAFV